MKFQLKANVKNISFKLISISLNHSKVTNWILCKIYQSDLKNTESKMGNQENRGNQENTGKVWKIKRKQGVK